MILSDVTKLAGLRVTAAPVIRNPRRVWLRMINRAQTRIYLAVYMLSDPKIHKALVYARKRLGPDNVKVVVGEDSPLRPEWATVSGPQTMHLKLLIVDSRLIYIGSHNATKSAMDYNLEAGVLIKSMKLAKIYEQLIDRVL